MFNKNLLLTEIEERIDLHRRILESCENETNMAISQAVLNVMEYFEERVKSGAYELKKCQK